MNSKKNMIYLIGYIILLFPILGENVIGTILGGGISKILCVFSCLIMILSLFNRTIRVSYFSIVMIVMTILHTIVFLFTDAKLKITAANNMITPYGLIGYMILFLFIDTYMDNRQKLSQILKSMTIIMTISVFLNFFITGDLQIANNIEVYREAISTGYTMSRKWLFGHRNMIFIHHMMWIVVSYLYFALEKKEYKKIFVFQIFFTMLVAIVSWNSTMIITTFLVTIAVALRNNILRNISAVHYFIVYFFLEIGIVFFRVQEIFSFIIVGLLHRNLSFTGRTNIWDYYINQFNRGDLIQILFGNLGVTSLSVNTHNMFLGLLVFTGIVGLVLYFFLVCLSVYNLHLERNTDTANIIAILLFGFLINALTMEFYLQPLLAIYFGYHISKINRLITIENKPIHERKM